MSDEKSVSALSNSGPAAETICVSSHTKESRMRLLSALALGFAILAAPAIAEDKEKELVGAFKKKAGDLDLKLTFKKGGVMVFNIDVGTDGAVMESKYTKDKDGV